jgi:hypothetical protein
VRLLPIGCSRCVLSFSRRALEIEREKANVANRAKTAFMATMVCARAAASDLTPMSICCVAVA